MKGRRRIATRVLVLFLLMLIMAACGGKSAVDPQAPAVGAAFASKAVAVCQAVLARKKAQGPFPYPGFNPTQPDASKFPVVAQFLRKTVDTFQSWLHQMQALGQPPAGQAAWADLLKSIADHVRLDVEQQAAAQSGDSQTFTKDYYGGQQTQADLFRAADAAGVPECAAVDR